MTDIKLEIEELIDLALIHAETTNSSLFQLNKTMNKLSEIDNVKDICNSNETYQAKLKELESKICQLPTYLKGVACRQL